MLSPVLTNVLAVLYQQYCVVEFRYTRTSIQIWVEASCLCVHVHVESFCWQVARTYWPLGKSFMHEGHGDVGLS